jgi:hypothetical protein
MPCDYLNRAFNKPFETDENIFSFKLQPVLGGPI